MMFTPEQQQFLLTLAREAVTCAVTRAPLAAPDAPEALFTQPLGAFVTLTKSGELRGCIGYPEAVYPLYEAIMHGGAAAALQDPRFPPVSPGELNALHIEISVLSPLRRATPEEVEVGTHGLVIEQGRSRGLLLPQVPVEWGWNREEFLAHTCRKAGLPADAWRAGATLYTFTAEVFSEDQRKVHRDDPQQVSSEL